jgi:thioredoxin 1
MSLESVTAKNFQGAVLGADIPVLVDLWAPWCGPCKMIGPVLESIAAEKAGNVKIVKVNIDEEPELAGQYNVQSIPTLLLFKKGEMVDRMMGAAPKNSLEGFLSRNGIA